MPTSTARKPSVTLDNQRLKDLSPKSADARSIAPRADSTALTTRELEDRRIIHRNDSAREQADAFRELRTRLLALGGERNFITLVASVGQGCGGSFVARNLAAAFAFDDSKSALLVDCDALHPSQHAALRVETTHGGLIDYLDERQPDLGSILYSTGIPRLQLIPSGSQREITGEAFSSLRMRMLVDSLHSRYPDRYLVLDAPPVLGSPDARILSGLADLVVLVAGYGKATPEQIDKAVASFAPEKLAGVVFNHIP